MGKSMSKGSRLYILASFFNLRLTRDSKLQQVDRLHMNCCWEKHCLYQYYWLEDGEAPCSQGNLGLMCRYVRKDVACPRMQLFEADYEMTAITWESSQERFRHLLGFSWEEECWDSLVYFDLWADVGESCFLSPWDWPSHPSIPLCRSMLSFRRLFRAPLLQSLHNIKWDWSWA